MENPNFLKKFPGLGNADEVISAKERTEKRTGEKVKGDYESLVQNYLDRLSDFVEHLEKFPEGKAKKKAAEKFKDILLEKLITKYENIPENYWREKDEDGNMGPFFREINDQGLSGDWSRMNEKEKEKYKKEHAQTLIENQRGSLEEWIEYFSDSSLSGDIPDYLKYWIFRSIINLQEYEKPKDWDKEKIEKNRNAERSPSEEGKEEKKTEGQFPRRSKNSLKKYPDLHAEALRYVTDSIIKKYEGKDPEFGHDIEFEEREKFKQYLSQENFAKLYGWAMESFNPIPEELLPITEGKWITFPKGSDHNEVSKKLKGKGTGLCIAGRGAAHRYLDSGDLHIFFSNDEEGNPVFPRIAIHSKDNRIAEMRGIAYKQNLDPFMTEVASQKCQEFQNGKEYEEKSEDMKKLSEIEQKTMQKEQLTKEDLIFLYEIDKSIKYFGMTKDPRIEQLRKSRDLSQDVSTIFECQPSQIAKSTNEITENTKAYIGKWDIEIFQTIRNYPNIKHFYESFPDKKIFMQTLETDPIMDSPEKAEKALKDKNIYITDWGKEILQKTEFSKESKEYELVRFTVGQLGFQNGATTDQVYQKAQELNLELCPAEVGPQLRLQYPGKEWMLIAMKQVADRLGVPDVFSLRGGDGRLWLDGYGAGPDERWCDDDRFVFRSRK